MARATDEGRYLLDGAWFPVTRGITFLEAELQACAELMVAWRGRAMHEVTGGTLRIRRVEDAPDTYDYRTNTGWWGSRGIAVYEPDATRRRGVRGSGVRCYVGEIGRHWDLSGPDEDWPLPDPIDYSARRTADKLSRTSLLDVASSLGIRVQDDDFYAPDGWGLLVELVGGRRTPGRNRTLAEAQGLATPPWWRR